MISLIVAYDDTRVIGKNGKLPWYFKDDLAYFKRITENHTCVMGRKTYESILERLHKPLPNRNNIVVSRTISDQRVTVIDDFLNYLKSVDDTEEEIFIIGGSEIYHMALPHADRLYITHIHGTYEGDIYFPEIDFTEYTRIYYEPKEHLSFAIYERRVL